MDCEEPTMKWTDTTPEQVDGAWNANATDINNVPTELACLERLRTSRFVGVVCNNIRAHIMMGMSLDLALTGSLVAALRTGWYVRDGLEGTVELTGLLSDEEMVRLRAEIAQVTGTQRLLGTASGDTKVDA